MLDAIDRREIEEIAALSKEARAAQDRLLNKMRIVDQFDDGKELAAQTAETLDALDATLDNGPLKDLCSRIAALPEAQRLELAAVMLLGRGDFAAQQWEAAIDEARARGDANDPDSLARKPDLADYLAKGLFQLDGG
jgi:Protein of unknown function (DUF3775)